MQIDVLGTVVDVAVTDLADLGLPRLGLAAKAVRLGQPAPGEPFLVLLSVKRLADLIRPAPAARGIDAAAPVAADAALLPAPAAYARG